MASSPESEMISTRSILSLVLSDPEGEIAAQTLTPASNKLETFHCFPLLVKELRLKIWQFAFPPPRRVELRPHRFCRKKSHDHACKCIAKHTAPLPVTLFVNCESRSETLRHYRVIKLEAEAQGTFNGKVKPLCFDPSRDILYTNIYDMIDFKIASWMVPFIVNRYLDRDSFKGVKVLEVRSWVWSDTGIGESLSKASFVGLGVFNQLEEIRLMLHHPKQYLSRYCSECKVTHQGRRWTDHDEKRSKEAVKGFFQRMQREDNFPTGDPKITKVPEVVIVPWTRRD
ncbi:hypothetical protein NHQ30_000455 [Ciborinia camelliae]|nr:hypothetical protein NHQ30_000455 [Ciborinia camelliae]